MILKLWGFEVRGPNPSETPKYILVAAPHTSNWDFPIGLLCKMLYKMPINYLIKDTIYKPPLSWFFKWTGGVPVRRDKSTNMVEQISKTFKEHKEFAVCIAVEGTRSYAQKIKTGFYHIAQKAQIPLIMCKIDWGQKQVVFSSPLDISTMSLTETIDYVMQHFQGTAGKHPQQSIFSQVS